MSSARRSKITASHQIVFNVIRPIVRILRVSGFSQEEILSECARACKLYARTLARGIWLDKTHGLGLDQSRITELMNLLRVWSQNPEFVDESGQPKRLDLDAGAGSFQELLRRAKCSLPRHRVLTQLQALGSVQLCDRGKRVRLLSNVLIVVVGNRFVVAPSIDSIRRFAETIEHNLFEGTRPGEGRIHRWATCDALDPAQLEEIQRFVRSSGQTFLEALDEKLIASALPSGRRPGLTYGVGLYVFTDKSRRRSRRRARRRKR